MANRFHSQINLILHRDGRPGDVASHKVTPMKDACLELSLSEDCPLLRYEMGKWTTETKYSGLFGELFLPHAGGVVFLV